ncbi:double-stranded RNA-binding protein 8-like [Panicum virgatum]|uniref:DRBM domain-containing protein n=1 Tax=Panicum virgatum TaxID=38727 RepID=A0A8T0N5E8_PANVG|nr:double-stranded RNA-binding protein 8-like [Panicum virgatum]KAG2544078.1 hypothetical protein PVAP13_9NG835966 [Panicum virgatum]
MDGGGAAPPDAARSTSPAPMMAAAPAGIRVENCYVFKSRLQEYAQKAGLPTPEYHTLKEGPSHEPIFKSTVVVNNTKYDSLPGFFSRKAAEQSAAEVALMEIVKSIPATECRSIPAVQETGLCKNLLQEYAQKMNYAIPSYICTKQASGVAPFICTVEIGGIQYIGAAARTKKEAEIKAARTALLAIQGRSEGCTNGDTKYIVVPGQREVKEAEKKPTETPKPLKVKRGGHKKKWNKRKFMRKTDQIFDVEIDGPRVAGDSDVPMQVTIAMEPFSDTIILQPEEPIRVGQELLRDTTMLQPDEEATIVKHGPAGETAMLLHVEEARVVEQQLARDTAMVQSNKEVVEPPSSSATLQPGEEASIVELWEPRSTKQESLSNVETLKPKDEARTIEQESLSGYVALQSNGSAMDAHEPGPPSNTAVMPHKEQTEAEATSHL